MAPTLETFTGGAETAVDVAGIERQLCELWQMAGEQVTRASLFNLVAFTETEAARDHATEIISALTSRHPCRAIVLLAQPAEPVDELTASITAHCHLAGGGQKQVCCEQISIYASGKSVSHLATAVLPLLESDLPSVLWWNGNFLEQPELFRRLGAVSDRVLFDSSMWRSPREHLAKLSKMIADNPRTSFADLSWTRLSLWRRLAAEAFDEPHCGAALTRVRRVEVVHGRGPGAALRALLLGAWAAAQLGWSAAEARERVRLKAREENDATAVGVLTFTMAGDDFEVSVRKSHGERTASATVTMPDACGLPRNRAFWPTDDASLLSQELDRSTPHRVFERALALAAEFPR